MSSSIIHLCLIVSITLRYYSSLSVCCFTHVFVVRESLDGYLFIETELCAESLSSELSAKERSFIPDAESKALSPEFIQKAKRNFMKMHTEVRTPISYPVVRPLRLRQNCFLQELLRVMYQVASGLQHLHSKNLVHLDIKPGTRDLLQ